MLNDRNKLGAAIRIGFSPNWSFHLTLNLGSHSKAAVEDLRLIGIFGSNIDLKTNNSS